MEEAFPDIKGETLTFSNGKEQIQIVKKGDYYVFLGDILLTLRQVNLLMQYYSSAIRPQNNTGELYRIYICRRMRLQRRHDRGQAANSVRHGLYDRRCK